ncbi:unnamed protein product [Alopecurus aequalis]
MPSLLSKVSGAVAASARSVSRTTRRLLRGRRSSRHKKEAAVPDGMGVVDEPGSLWRREILMGKRCEPLNFSGSIHYDSHGRRIVQPRRRVKEAVTSLCRSSDVVDKAVVAVSKEVKCSAPLQS